MRAIVRGLGVTLPNGKPLPVSLTSYAVVGAAAYMGGATRMTLTTTVMVMETTGALQLIVPIIITVFVAKVGFCSAGLCLHASPGQFQHTAAFPVTRRCDSSRCWAYSDMVKFVTSRWQRLA